MRRSNFARVATQSRPVWSLGDNDRGPVRIVLAVCNVPPELFFRNEVGRSDEDRRVERRLVLSEDLGIREPATELIRRFHVAMHVEVKLRLP